MVGELSVGPPLGVDPMRQMRLRIQNKQTNIASVLVVPINIIDGQHTHEMRQRSTIMNGSCLLQDIHASNA